MDNYTKNFIKRRVEEIINRVEKEIGHTNGYSVASTILKEVKKL